MLKHYRRLNSKSLAILSRIANYDKSAIEMCIATYGNLVWNLAKKHTSSLPEAETATLEIFQDIWKFLENYDPAKFEETTFIFLIARRRLLKRRGHSIAFL